MCEHTFPVFSFFHNSHIERKGSVPPFHREEVRPGEIEGSCSEGYSGTEFTQNVEGVAKQQTLEPRKMRQPETWGTVRLECVVVVAPGPWNETEGIAKSWALREEARGPGPMGPGG